MINKIIEIINAGGYPACISPELNILVGVNNLAVITPKGYRIYKRKGLSLNMLPRAVQIFVLYEWNSETVEDFFKSCAEFKKDEDGTIDKWTNGYNVANISIQKRFFNNLPIWARKILRMVIDNN